jgi:hypothetical protein
MRIPYPTNLSSPPRKILKKAINIGNSDSESEDESVLEEPIFDKINQAYDFNTNNIAEIRDRILARKDNIVIFVTQVGKPCDNVSHLLAKGNKVPVIKDATLGRAKVIKQRSMYLIALVTKTRASALLEKEILKEALSTALTLRCHTRVKFTSNIFVQNRYGICILG